MMHFPPVSDLIPPLSENIFRLRGKCLSDDLLLVINNKFRIPPYFRYLNTFPPISRKLFFPPTFQNSSCFRKIYVFLHILCVFLLHVLDAPASCLVLFGKVPIWDSQSKKSNGIA